MNWRHKLAIQKLAGSSAIGRKAYRFATSRILRSRLGEPRKWCFWFREHALLISRHAKILPLRGDVWCADPGLTHTAVLLLRLSAQHVFVTNRLGPLSKSYLDESLSTIERNLPALARSLKIDTADAARQISKSVEEISADRAIWLQDEGSDLGQALAAASSGSVDTFISMGTLEHYRREELPQIFLDMFRVLRRGGVMSHIIDLRDHFHHADNQLHPLNHLRHSLAQWARKTSPLSFTNQMRRSHYLQMVEAAGFEILYSGFDPHGDYPPLGDEIHIEHRTGDPVDDEARVIHIVARKS